MPLDVRCRASSPPHACIAKPTSRTVVPHHAATPSFLPCSRTCLHGRAVHHIRTMLLISRCHPRPSHRQLRASRIHPTPVAHAFLWQTKVVQGSMLLRYAWQPSVKSRCSARRQRLEADTSDNREQVTEQHRYRGAVAIPCVAVEGFQCPLLKPVQQAQDNDNRGMVEVELSAAQQQHYSASEAVLVYNQQLHADQSANAIVGETSSSADGALMAGAAHTQSNCRPVRVSRAQRRVCSFMQPGVLGMREAENFLRLLHATNVHTADPSNSASAQGSRNFQRHVTF